MSDATDSFLYSSIREAVDTCLTIQAAGLAIEAMSGCSKCGRGIVDFRNKKIRDCTTIAIENGKFVIVCAECALGVISSNGEDGKPTFAMCK